MQPQGPYPQQPYPPQGPPYGPPGQPGQFSAPGQSGPLPGQTYGPQLASPSPMPQPQIPGQPPMPVYQPPKNKNRDSAQGQMAPLPDAPTTPYDFFMQPKPTPSLIPLPANGKRLGSNPNQQNGGGSKRGFFLLIGGAIAVVFLLLGVLAFSPKDARPLQFFGLAQTQQEIIRLCNQGSSSKAKYQSTRNFAITCSTGVTTSQSQILAYMKRGNMEYDPKQIGGKANGQTDARLSQAIASSTYDDVFREIMKTRLTAYSQQLTAQLQTTTDSTGRETLAKNAKTLELISKMLADATDTTEAAPEASGQ